jgi:hypothetical protein
VAPSPQDHASQGDLPDQRDQEDRPNHGHSAAS